MTYTRENRLKRIDPDIHLAEEIVKRDLKYRGEAIIIS